MVDHSHSDTNRPAHPAAHTAAHGAERSTHKEVSPNFHGSHETGKRLLESASADGAMSRFGTESAHRRQEDSMKMADAGQLPKLDLNGASGKQGKSVMPDVIEGKQPKGFPHNPENDYPGKGENFMRDFKDNYEWNRRPERWPPRKGTPNPRDDNPRIGGIRVTA